MMQAEHRVRFSESAAKCHESFRYLFLIETPRADSSGIHEFDRGRFKEMLRIQTPGTTTAASSKSTFVLFSSLARNAMDKDGTTQIWIVPSERTYTASMNSQVEKELKHGRHTSQAATNSWRTNVVFDYLEWLLPLEGNELDESRNLEVRMRRYPEGYAYRRAVFSVPGSSQENTLSKRSL